MGGPFGGRQSFLPYGAEGRLVGDKNCRFAELRIPTGALFEVVDVGVGIRREGLPELMAGEGRYWGWMMSNVHLPVKGVDCDLTWER